MLPPDTFPDLPYVPSHAEVEPRYHVSPTGTPFLHGTEDPILSDYVHIHLVLKEHSVIITFILQARHHLELLPTERRI